MNTSTKSLSTSYVSVHFSVKEKTTRLFMLKIKEAMESSGNNSITGIVLARREKDKVVKKL